MEDIRRDIKQIKVSIRHINNKLSTDIKDLENKIVTVQYQNSSPCLAVSYVVFIFMVIITVILYRLTRGY